MRFIVSKILVYRLMWCRFTSIVMLILTACAADAAESGGIPTPTPMPTQSTTISTPLPGNLDSVTFTEDGTVYTIGQLLPRDGIRPIYDPQFVPADESSFDDEELVMGVAINGDARAYPVGLLTRREMVNDTIGGTPVLVSW